MCFIAESSSALSFVGRARLYVNSFQRRQEIVWQKIHRKIKPTVAALHQQNQAFVDAFKIPYKDPSNLVELFQEYINKKHVVLDTEKPVLLSKLRGKFLHYMCVYAPRKVLEDVYKRQLKTKQWKSIAITVQQLMELLDPAAVNLQDFEDATVAFTHFIPITYVPETCSLKEYYQRRCAVILKRNNPGADIMIPVKLAEDRYSYILAQLKNYASSDRNADKTYPESGSSKLTSRFVFQQSDLKDHEEQYITLYWPLGFQGQLREIPPIRESKCQKLEQKQHTFAHFGLDTFEFLDSSIKKELADLLDAFISPFDETWKFENEETGDHWSEDHIVAQDPLVYNRYYIEFVSGEAGLSSWLGLEHLQVLISDTISKPFLFDYKATIGPNTAIMKKAAKSSSSDDGFEMVLSRKKRRGGVLEDDSSDSETGNTTESESIDMKEECLVEETSFDFGESGALTGEDHNQTPTSSKVKTKKTLGKPLGKIDFSKDGDSNSILSDAPLDLPPPLKNLVNVSVRKSFTLDIGLNKVASYFSQEKLVVVRKLFSGINGFGGASILSKFLGIIRATFTSELSLIKAIDKAANRAVVIKEIPIGTSAEAVRAVLSEFGVIKVIKMQLIGLWQKAVVEFEQLDQADLVAAEWSILIRKDAIHVARANSDKKA
ncbi:hypothetical protein G9A89_010770 [Geosiphon pyriformis]|nr:hypothetical protein G9A89_010770 [Geosiphon pyriformis]